jgi:hypothetical protein
LFGSKRHVEKWVRFAAVGVSDGKCGVPGMDMDIVTLLFGSIIRSILIIAGGAW